MRHRIIFPLQLRDQKYQNVFLKSYYDFPGMNAPDLESSEQLDCLFTASLNKVNLHIFQTYLNVRCTDYDYLNTRTRIVM